MTAGIVVAVEVAVVEEVEAEADEEAVVDEGVAAAEGAEAGRFYKSQDLLLGALSTSVILIMYD